MATIENFATVSYTSGGVAETKISNLAEIGLNSAVSLQKNSLGDTYGDGSELTHILTIGNTSSAPITNVSITDDLGTFPFNTTELTPLTYVGPALFLVNGQDMTAQLTVNTDETNQVVFSFPSMPANSSANIIYKTRVNEFAPLILDSAITTTATLTSDADCADGTATEVLNVAQAANVSVFKQMSPNPVVCGDTVTYTIRIYNYGNIPAENVTLTDRFDPAPDNITVSRGGAALPTGDYTYTDGLLTVPGTGGTTDVTVPAAVFTSDPTTGAVTVTPGIVEYVITGTI